jgi:hypothetical protein
MSFENILSHVMTPKHTLIAFATAWGPRFGGINAFNIDLLKAVAAAYWQPMDVFCMVADCTVEEIEVAKTQYLVNLVKLDLLDGKIGAEHEPLVWSKLQAAGCSPASDRTVWLGHDSITGAVANASAKARGGRSALIHHMSYARYESFSENSAAAHAKEKTQRALFQAADIRLAVGPLLRDELAEFVDQAPVQVAMLIPGLPDITHKVHKNSFIAFVSGRLDVGAQKIKQAHLGVAGFAIGTPPIQKL